jgi:hypothetical protein
VTGSTQPIDVKNIAYSKPRGLVFGDLGVTVPLKTFIYGVSKACDLRFFNTARLHTSASVDGQNNKFKFDRTYFGVSEPLPVRIKDKQWFLHRELKLEFGVKFAFRNLTYGTDYVVVKYDPSGEIKKFNLDPAYVSTSPYLNGNLCQFNVTELKKLSESVGTYAYDDAYVLLLSSEVALEKLKSVRRMSVVRRLLVATPSMFSWGLQENKFNAGGYRQSLKMYDANNVTVEGLRWIIKFDECIHDLMHKINMPCNAKINPLKWNLDDDPSDPRKPCYIYPKVSYVTKNVTTPFFGCNYFNAVGEQIKDPLSVLNQTCNVKVNIHLSCMLKNATVNSIHIYATEVLIEEILQKATVASTLVGVGKDGEFDEEVKSDDEEEI